MKVRSIFILILIFTIIFSVNLISASNIDDNSTMLEDSNLEVDLSLVNEINTDYELSEGSDNILSDNDLYVLWVDEKNVEDGNGSESNPYKNFELARDDVASGKNNVIINVAEGTYNLNSQLLFNTNNLYINATSDNVIIKNNPSGYFQLSNSGGNFSVYNVLFDGKYTTGNTAITADNYILKGDDANLVTFNNCTFKECYALLYYDYNGNPYLDSDPYIFNNCKFIYSSVAATSPMVGLIFRNVKFKNCMFDFTKLEQSFSAGEKPEDYGHSTVFEDCWFGINGVPKAFYNDPSRPTRYLGYTINRYAIFSISENYLGNNIYEITGKLMWNDSTTDGFENLNPMNVTLKVDKGGYLDQTTAILKNGTFKVQYTSNSSDNKITATLNQQPSLVEFQSISISLDSPIITYGDKQNITVTLPKQYNGIITVAVNNKTYSKELEYEDVITVDITDVLNAGTWDVNVNFIDNETPSAHTYGFNTTTITVNKVSNYDFDATITPNTVYIGENATVTLSLPDGATGNVTIKVGENEAKTFNINDTIIINGFVTGDNVVNITFNGDNYKSQSVEKHVLASTKPTTITATNVTTDYKVAKDLVITLTSNNEVLANKTINVVVGSINENFTTDVEGKVSIDISNLDPNTYVATISFAGDELYNSSSTTATVVVKADIKTDITIPEITAGKATTTTIKLPENATGNITLTVDGKIISVVNLTNGSATITIPELTAGKHDVVISYSGDGNYAAFSQNSTVTVKEQAKPTPTPAPVKKTKQATKIIAKNKKFKAKTKVKKYTITLKTKAGKAVKKVQVTIKIGKKTYKAKTNSKGKATFKIKKLTKKAKYKATIKFKGNANYKAVTKKVKITIKK